MEVRAPMQRGSDELQLRLRAQRRLDEQAQRAGVVVAGAAVRDACEPEDAGSDAADSGDGSD